MGRLFCTFSFFIYSYLQSSGTSRGACITTGAPQQSPLPRHFLHSLQLLQGSLLVRKAGKLALHRQPTANSENVLQDGRKPMAIGSPHTFSIAHSLSPRKHFDHPGRRLWQLLILVKSGINCFSPHIMRLCDLMTLSHQSFSTSAHAMRFLRSASAGFSYFALAEFSARPYHGRPS
jgi:hypothetical protein